jgi:hypothetical protein
VSERGGTDEGEKEGEDEPVLQQDPVMAHSASLAVSNNDWRLITRW